MADIQKRLTAGGTKWDVRYRDETTRQRKKTFDRKVDAQRFANSVETDLARGDWIDPNRGRELFGEWAETWLATIANRKPKSRESYESIVHKHLRPRFGKAPIGSMDYPIVLAYVAQLREAGAAPKTVRNIRDVMRMIFKLAVRSGALKSNPVEDVPVGQTQRAEMVFLEPEQIMTLAREVTNPPARYRRGERRVDGYPEYGLFVRFAAFTGLRAGELVGLRVKDVQLMKRRVHVQQSASEAYGQLQIVPTKTYERRSVPIPKSLIEELAVATYVLTGGSPCAKCSAVSCRARRSRTRVDSPCGEPRGARGGEVVDLACGTVVRRDGATGWSVSVSLSCRPEGGRLAGEHRDRGGDGDDREACGCGVFVVGSVDPPQQPFDTDHRPRRRGHTGG